jgi:hypothetical protein
LGQLPGAFIAADRAGVREVNDGRLNAGAEGATVRVLRRRLPDDQGCCLGHGLRFLFRNASTVAVEKRSVLSPATASRYPSFSRRLTVGDESCNILATSTVVRTRGGGAKGVGELVIDTP